MARMIGFKAWLRYDVWYPVVDAYYEVRYRIDNLLHGYERFIALVEVAKAGVSVGMMRSPAYRFEWVAKWAGRFAAFRLRHLGDAFYIRVYESEKALEVEARYVDWLAILQLSNPKGV